MADEFDQYKVSPPSEDEFAQYKVAPAIIPPPAAGPHIDVQPESVSGFVNRVTGHPNYQSQPITPQSIAKGAASDLWTLDKSGAQAVAHGVTSGKAFPLGKPDTEQVTRAGVNVGIGMLLGGLEGEGIAPTQGLNDAINGSPKTPGLSPTLSVASKLMREVPGIGGALRKLDLFKDLIPEQNVPRGTPAAPTTNGVPWGKGKFGTPMAQWGEKVPVYPGAPFPEPKPVYPGAPYPQNPVEILRARALGQGPQVYNDPAAGLGKIPVKPASADPWANLKFDKAAQEQARTELGANADTTRVLERAQEIKTQMMQQGSQYQVVKVGTLPKAKGNPYAGLKTQMESAQSGNVARHGYDPATQTGTFEFKNGNVYDVQGIPKEIFEQYRASESQGSFYANNIKGRYQTKLRGTVKPTPGVRVKQALGGQP